MVNSKHGSDRRIDPVGIELILSIYSAALSTIVFLYEFGPQVFRPHEEEKSQPLKDVLPRLAEAIELLQNSIDDLVVMLAAAANRDPDIVLSGSPTIRDTLLSLRERDYLRWKELTGQVKTINDRIYEVVQGVRSRVEPESGPSEEAQALAARADELVLGLIDTTFEQFIVDLRGLVRDLSKVLGESS